MAATGSTEGGLFDASELRSQIQHAVNDYWIARRSQKKKQAKSSGVKDRGNRSEVTGGKHLDSFIQLISNLTLEACPGVKVYTQRYLQDKATVLPGFFRATKLWDLVLVYEGMLIGCVELKSQVGSLGNNYNNRSEELIGLAKDIQVAYREGAFEPSPPPWVGYLMLLEDTEASNKSRATGETHFPVFEDFRGASYARRYEVGLLRLVREQLLSSGVLLLAEKDVVPAKWREPNQELRFDRFMASLLGHTRSVVTMKS